MSNCPHCHGKGRVVGETLFGQGHAKPVTLTEIGICPACHGIGTDYCCGGAGENYGEQRAEVIIEIAEALEEAINEAE